VRDVTAGTERAPLAAEHERADAGCLGLGVRGIQFPDRLLVEGSVAMTENYALEPDELERGYVLTCQSHPKTDRVVVDYDV